VDPPTSTLSPQESVSERKSIPPPMANEERTMPVFCDKYTTSPNGQSNVLGEVVSCFYRLSISDLQHRQ
jgi:hypothetical protein